MQKYININNCELDLLTLRDSNLSWAEKGLLSSIAAFSADNGVLFDWELIYYTQSSKEQILEMWELMYSLTSKGYLIFDKLKGGVVIGINPKFFKKVEDNGNL